MKIVRVAHVGLEQAIAEASRILSEGGIVLYPTDTLYGFAVDARNIQAIERLRLLKGRERKKPMSVVVPSIAVMKEHAQLHAEAEMLAARHLPGALTLVLPACTHIPTELILNGALGFRIPDDAFALGLAHAFGAPYTATSANISGHETRHDAMDIVVAMGPNTRYIDLVIDDGLRAGGMPSTVVEYGGEAPRVLREGRISRQELGF